jgi:putative endonuclease
MYIIYALKFSDGRTYIGMTNNLKRRIAEHKRGKTKSTKGRGKFELVCVESHYDRLRAHRREKYWKSGCGKEQIKLYFSHRGRSSAG